jgi:hypothetical protein
MPARCELKKGGTMTQMHSFHNPAPDHLYSKGNLFSDQHEDQFAAAKKEMGAFVTAVSKLYGKLEAERAADCWITQAENTDALTIHGYPNWRHVTVAAASQLAASRSMVRNPTDS